MFLAIDAILPDILGTLATSPNLVIEAPPGAGKTTRVPRALLELQPDNVIVLEPRRLAARMAARRVAQELGEAVGRTVGYQVRFEECGGRETRLWYWTEGVLTRRLLSDPTLRGAGVVVLDEFHERHIDTDLAIALLRRLQRTSRPDLRIVAMSATIASAPIAQYLGDAKVLRSEGRLYPLEIRYTPHSATPLEEQVAAAFERVVSAGVDGDILTFLPGAAEIRRTERLCEAAARRANITVAPLYGDLPPAEQDRAVLPGPQPKLILSTNVAESSITIEGVTTVIDSGVARVAADSPWTGLPSLNIARISKASARQRAGRAGRVRPGRVIRLYSEDDFTRRPEHDTPEILRRELSHVLLDLHAMGVPGLDWFQPPPEAAWTAAGELLERLGAIGPAGLTAAGREMASLPLHPRLSRIVVEAQRRGVGDSGCAVAAVLSAGGRMDVRPAHPAPSDLLVMIEREWPGNARRVYEQVRRSSRGRPAGGRDEQPLLISILRGFPDRVARRRQGSEYLLAGGGSAALSETSAAAGEEFIVAVDLESRRERGLPLIRIASAIRPDWLFDLFPDRVEDRSGVEWNKTAERAEAVSALLYDGLTIDETRGGNPDPHSAAQLLYDKAIEAGVERFVDRDELEAFRARVAFAAERSAIRAIGEEDVRAALRELCEGKRSFTELARADLTGALRARTPALGRLEEIAPARLRLPGGRQVQVHYEPGKPPWIESRLQDFFGMRDSPRIGGAPVVVHLLAPNRRPVQMTSDLAGFWERLYPQVRRELSRKYPRHAWPEKPV
jgi:ATP-dependent helicase HrpB